jgi:hypothetical protein
VKWLKTAHLGGRANLLLKQYKHYSVIGVTSRGVFFAPPEKWTLFLSREPFRGPLTINLTVEARQAGTVRKGDRITHLGGHLQFQKSGLKIDLANAQVWEPALPGKNFVQSTKEDLICAIIENGDRFLHALLDNKPVQTAELSPLERRLAKFELDDGENLRGILGAGTGLTPEGDDFLLGLAYALKISQGSDQEIIAWLEELTAQAYQRTTTLSANLIECAAAGQVDERIMDFLVALSLRGNISQTMHALLNWGATSGRMVLAGIIRGLELSG